MKFELKCVLMTVPILYQLIPLVLKKVFLFTAKLKKNSLKKLHKKPQGYYSSPI